MQVEHAPHKSGGAALVKLADKICNLRDIAAAPPADWSLARRQEYFDWAKRVVDGLPKVSDHLLAAFDEAYALRPRSRPSDPLARDGHWLSMPGERRGTSGFVRVLDEGSLEVEVYDHSPEAEGSFGREFSAIYRVEKNHLVALAERLAIGFGGPVSSLADLPDQLTSFLDVQSLVKWLTEDSGIEFSKRLDFDV